MATTRLGGRWKVKEYHKSIKSCTAFPTSPNSTVIAHRSHFIAVILANVKMERLKVRHHKSHFALKALLIKNATVSAWNKLNELNINKNYPVYKAP